MPTLQSFHMGETGFKGVGTGFKGLGTGLKGVGTEPLQVVASLPPVPFTTFQKYCSFSVCFDS